jgi:hypothetical protein
MALYQVALEQNERSYQRNIEASCPEHAAEEWAERYCAEQAEYEAFECFVWLGASAPVKIQIDIESSPVFNATII